MGEVALDGTMNGSVNADVRLGVSKRPRNDERRHQEITTNGKHLYQSGQNASPRGQTTSQGTAIHVTKRVFDHHLYLNQPKNTKKEALIFIRASKTLLPETELFPSDKVYVRQIVEHQ